MVKLRDLIARPHSHGLRRFGRLLDTEVDDPLFLERVQRIHAQITAAIILRQVLVDMGIVVDYSVTDQFDLYELASLARREGVINRREESILFTINSLANEAKHQIRFPSRK